MGFRHRDGDLMATAAQIERSSAATSPSALAPPEESVEREARHPRHDLELLFPGLRGGGAGVLQGGRARCLARADLPGRQVLRGAARGPCRFRRRLGAFCARRHFPSGRASSSSARRARACTGSWSCAPIFRRQARRARHRQGPQHRRRALGRHGPASNCSSTPAIDLERDNIRIAPVPGAMGAGVNFGVTAARALADRKIDGFWANGMGAEVAVQQRRRHRRARHSPRRRTQGLLRLHDGNASPRPSGSSHPIPPRRSRGRARHRQDAEGAQGRRRRSRPRSAKSCSPPPRPR